MKKNAVLFYSRDFLSLEFPRLASQFADLARVYLVTSDKEKNNVLSIDKDAVVFDLQTYFNESKVGMSQEVVPDYALQHHRISKDRFIRRMESDGIHNAILSVAKLIQDINELYSVKIYFDEPVSGYINFSLNRYVRNNGGVAAQISLAWVPGYIFFVAGENQETPLPINSLSNGIEIVNEHAEKRLQNKNRPRYVVDFNSSLFSLKQSFVCLLKGFRRDLLSREMYLNSDSWPHYFQSKCLFNHALKKYIKIEELEQGGDTSYAIYPLHYEPEALLSYYSQHRNQVILLEKLLDKLPPNHKLVIKEHPSQPGALKLSRWNDLRANRRVVMIRGTENLTDLFKKENAYMLSIASTAALEALLHEVPVFLFGKPYFYQAPGVTYIEDVDNFEIPDGHTNHTKEEFLKWYGGYMNLYCIEGQFLKNNTIVPDLVSLDTQDVLERIGSRGVPNDAT